MIVFSISEFPIKPVAYKDRYYIRKNNSNYKLNIGEIVDLRFASLQYSFDSYVVDARFEDLNSKPISVFLKKKLIERKGSKRTGGYYVIL